MKFCPDCGNDTKGSTKFCPECGINLSEYLDKNTPKITDKIVVNSFSENSEITARELGNKLEDAVAKIHKDQGYEVLLRQKLSGRSGQHNEIDILAKQGQVVLAIECKNYSEGRKIGISHMRDFIAKLDDLDIHQGLFVTNTEFSSDAIGWAKNGSTKPIELWDGNELQQKIMENTIGRTENITITIQNCLTPKGSFGDYTILTLRNSERVVVKEADLIFYPFHIVSFNLHDRVKTPDRHIRTISNTGKYFVDALSGKILYYEDEHGNVTSTSNDEEKEFIQELSELDPTIVEVAESTTHKIIKHPLSVKKQDAEFSVRNSIAEDNKANLEYEVKISREEYKVREYHYKPPIKAITVQSRVVYIPKWEIEYESGEHLYKKTVFPASDVIARDEIAICKHLLRKKPTFAVCNTCGIAKCEGDITQTESGEYFCKNHIPDEFVEHKESFTSKIKKIKFRK